MNAFSTTIKGTPLTNGTNSFTGTLWSLCTAFLHSRSELQIAEVVWQFCRLHFATAGGAALHASLPTKEPSSCSPRLE